MQQVTDNYWSGEVKLEEVCAPTAHAGGVLVRTAFSLISAGTERGNRAHESSAGTDESGGEGSRPS